MAAKSPIPLLISQPSISDLRLSVQLHFPPSYISPVKIGNIAGIKVLVALGLGGHLPGDHGGDVLGCLSQGDLVVLHSLQ